MPGPVSVSLRCEPSYFQATCERGSRQTLVVSDQINQRIVGMGVRSIRTLYVDGQPTDVGYLSGLRILPQHQRGTLLARGYREMRRLHEDHAADYYLTTVVDGNQPALDLLTAGRRCLPTYDLLGQYHTFVMPLRQRRSRRVTGDDQIRSMRENELSKVVEFLRREGRARLFFPCYDETDFAKTSTFGGLSNHDILTAWRGNELVGLLGVWNQRSFKQYVVEGYRPMLHLARSAFNGLARCLHWPTFPAIGKPVPTTVAAFPLVKDDDPRILQSLLNSADTLVRNRDPDSRSILIGAFQRDPLLELVSRRSLYRFVSSVFLVYWDKGVVHPDRFRDRNLYLELGCL